MGLIRRTASQPNTTEVIMPEDQVNSELNIIEDEEMIDLSVPNEYNEYTHNQVIKPWRDNNPLSE